MSLLRCLTRGRRGLLASPARLYRVVPGAVVPRAPLRRQEVPLPRPTLLLQRTYATPAEKQTDGPSKRPMIPKDAPLPVLPEEYVKYVKQVKKDMKGQEKDVEIIYQFFWVLFGLVCTVGAAVPFKISALGDKNDKTQHSIEVAKERQAELTTEISDLRMLMNELKASVVPVATPSTEDVSPQVPTDSKGPDAEEV